LVRDEVSDYAPSDPLEHGMLHDGTSKDENFDAAMCAHFLEASPQILPSLARVEDLMSDDKSLFDKERAPKVELKPIPSSLRYKFLGPNSKYPVIVNANLSISQIDSSLRVLRLHYKAI